MKKLSAVSALFWMGAVCAQANNNAFVIDIRNVEGIMNEAKNTSGVIDSDVQIEGITIINQKVFIDGIEVPKNASIFISKSTKKTYNIRRDKNGNVSVSEN